MGMCVYLLKFVSVEEILYIIDIYIYCGYKILNVVLIDDIFL